MQGRQKKSQISLISSRNKSGEKDREGGQDEELHGQVCGGLGIVGPGQSHNRTPVPQWRGHTSDRKKMREQGAWRL